MDELQARITDAICTIQTVLKKHRERWGGTHGPAHICGDCIDMDRMIRLLDWESEQIDRVPTSSDR